MTKQNAPEAGSESSAMVRRVVGWRVGQWSASGVGHYYMEHQRCLGRSLCGDEWSLSLLQGEDQIIRRCKKCENKLGALSA